MKKFILIALLVLLIIGGFTVFLNSMNKKQTEEEANIILNKIEEVEKLIVVEGNFAEVYTYKQATRLFYDIWPVEKKIIVIVEATASVGYDLKKVDFTIDKNNKQIVINSIPEEEIIIEPVIKYYDIQDDQFYRINEEDLTRANDRAVELIRKKVKASNLPETAEKRLKDVLRDIVFTTEDLNWEIITNSDVKNLY